MRRRLGKLRVYRGPNSWKMGSVQSPNCAGCVFCGFVVSRFHFAGADGDCVRIEADGKGGAKLLIVCGNYPSDYSIKTERQFSTEDDACNAAEEMVERATNVPAAAR